MTTRISDNVLPTLSAAPTNAVVSIIAGAGTGKTTALTTRYVALLKADPTLSPQDIVVLTFTEKAATEMRARIIHAVANDDQLSKRFSRIDMAEASISTFHVYAATLALRHTIASDLDPDAPFADEFDAQHLRLKLWDEFLRDAWQHAITIPHDAVSEIAWNKDNLRNALHTIFADAKSRGEDSETFATALAPTTMDSAVARVYVETLTFLYAAYDHALAREGKLDLDDLMRLVPQLITRFPAERTAIRVLLVDEFQDTNDAQDDMMRALTPHHHGQIPTARFIVGDPRQSIYLWRQAKPENLQRADRESPAAYRLTLRENYRSLQPILTLANHSLQTYQFHSDADRREFDEHDTLVIGKPDQNENVPHDAVILAEYPDVGHEIQAIVQRVHHLHVHAHVPYGDMAVLVRARHFASPIIAAFKRAGIPYDDGALTPFFKIPLIIDAAHTLIAAADPYAELSLTRTVWQATGVWNEETLATLRTANRGTPLWELLLNAQTNPRAHTVVNALRAGFRSKTYTHPATWARTVLVDSGVWTRDGRYGQRLLQRLIAECSAESHDVAGFIADIRLAMETGRDVAAPERRTDTDTVNIMTVHASKGLEFCAVFVPSARSFSYRPATSGLIYKTGRLLLDGKDASLADYRRQEQNEVLATFYVAVTRAKCWLMVTSERKIKDTTARVFFASREYFATHLTHGILTEYATSQQSITEGRGTAQQDTAIVLEDIPHKPVVSLTPSTMSELVHCPRRFRYSRRSGLAGIGETVAEPRASAEASPASQSAYTLPTPIPADDGNAPEQPDEPVLSETVTTDNDARLLGSLFHHVCELHAHQPTLPATSLVEHAVRAVNETVSADTQATCLAFTTRYLETELARTVQPWIAIEQRLSWKVERPAAVVQFSGVVDRYDGTTVIDYKTDTDLEGLAERHGDQLRLYGAALAAVSGDQAMPSLALYHARSGTTIPIDNSPAALADTYERLDTAIQWLVRDAFPAIPEFRSCRHCPARWLCPEGHALVR